jgi:hypothetical protein
MTLTLRKTGIKPNINMKIFLCNVHVYSVFFTQNLDKGLVVSFSSRSIRAFSVFLEDSLRIISGI